MPDLGIPVWFIAKLFALFAAVVYLIFAAVVMRQVHLMTETIAVGFEAPLKTLVWVHLIVAIVVFLFALVVL